MIQASSEEPWSGPPPLNAAYGLSSFDAHVWTYAEHYGLDELISEDFQHDR